MKITGKILGITAQDKNYKAQQNLRVMAELNKEINFGTGLKNVEAITTAIGKIANEIKSIEEKENNKGINTLIIIEIDKSQTAVIDGQHYLPVKHIEDKEITSYSVELEYDQEENRYILEIDTKLFPPFKENGNNLAFGTLFPLISKNISIVFDKPRLDNKANIISKDTLPKIKSFRISD